MEYERYQSLAFERRDRVLTISLNRPETLNAIDAELHEDLSRVFYDVSLDQEIEVVVLTGAGRAFCAGGDLDWLEGVIDEPYAWQKLAQEGRRIVMSILEARQPIIAKINGAAVGLGATLALASDISYAAESARIGDPHVRVGFAAGDGGSLLWPSLIGYARAREFLYTGELLDARRAADMGLINHAVPDDELDAVVDAFADSLANGPIRAIQWTKIAINGPLKQIAAANLDTGLSLEGLSNLTADHREGIRAFRERRDPKFTGR